MAVINICYIRCMCGHNISMDMDEDKEKDKDIDMDYVHGHVQFTVMTK